MEKSLQIGFHTCGLKNSFDYIRENIPFLSRASDDQWLTQGYYFWTDSSYWAKRWGREGQRVIGKFTIELCLESELFDLVGNVEHQIEFKAFIERFTTKLQEKGKAITVNQILCELREDKNIFPYLAVKANDDRFEGKIAFIDDDRHMLKLVTRQQMCVFNEARERIKLQEFVEPQHFVDKMTVS